MVFFALLAIAMMALPAYAQAEAPLLQVAPTGSPLLPDSASPLLRAWRV